MVSEQLDSLLRLDTDERKKNNFKIYDIYEFMFSSPLVLYFTAIEQFSFPKDLILIIKTIICDIIQCEWFVALK